MSAGEGGRVTSEVGPLVAMIHATPLAQRPAAAAFAELFPQARLWHLLDDQLMPAVRASGELTPRLRRRILRLIEHVLVEQADAVLLTCSSYTPAVDAARQLWEQPILKPDESMYRRLVDDGVRRVGVLASVPASVEPACEQIATLGRAAGTAPQVEAVCCEEAADAAAGADRGRVADLLCRAAGGLVERRVEALVLAQYSLSAAREPLLRAFGLPVYTGPHAAVLDVRELLGRRPDTAAAPDAREGDR